MIIFAEIVMILFSLVIAFDQGITSPDPNFNPHSSFHLEVTCLDCHDTYLDEVDDHEFVVEITDVCEGCHDLKKLGRSHPYDVDVTDTDLAYDIPDDVPLHDDMVTCGSCHDPHIPYLNTEKSFKKQLPLITADTDYYRSFYTRKTDPEHGWDLLCDSCHHLL